MTVATVWREWERTHGLMTQTSVPRKDPRKMEISAGGRGLTPTSHHAPIIKLPKAKELKVRKQDVKLWEEDPGDCNVWPWVGEESRPRYIIEEEHGCILF